MSGPNGRLLRQVSVAGSSNLLLGLAFHPQTGALLVLDLGNHQVLNVNPRTSAASVFATLPGGSGPNALTFDKDGNVYDDDNLWVAANQADESVVIDKTGKVIAKLGDFGDIDKHGAPVGFMFPASPARYGDWICVTNLALDIRWFGLPRAVDSQWAAQVSLHTIARIRARIPRLTE